MACAIIFAFHISAAPTFAALEAGVFVFSFVLQLGLIIAMDVKWLAFIFRMPGFFDLHSRHFTPD